MARSQVPTFKVGRTYSACGKIHVANNSQLCSQRVMIFEREVGCDPNTQIFLEVERGDVTCLGAIVDDESIRRGASKGHMSALSVVDGKVPRD